MNMAKRFTTKKDVVAKSVESAMPYTVAQIKEDFERMHCVKDDPVDHPLHYTVHPSGVECIQITEHMSFCLGNAMKYIWRADMKNGIEDLKKAKWYLEREIARREA